MRTLIPEAQLLHAILLRWGAHPRVRLWRQNSGLLYAPDANGGFHRVRAGVPGAGDLSGVIAPSGRRLEIECKSATGRLRPEQEAFGRMVLSMGGLYILARSLEDVARILEPVLAETAT